MSCKEVSCDYEALTLSGKHAWLRRSVAMTANAFEKDRKNALDAGMNGHIAKPINVEILLSTLSEVLR